MEIMNLIRATETDNEAYKWKVITLRIIFAERTLHLNHHLSGSTRT